MPHTPLSEPALELFVVLSRAHNWVNAHAIRDIRSHGLNPTEFGILDALYHKGPLPLQHDEWARQTEAWRELGATHITINTMNAGYTSPIEHIEAIRRYKVAIGE